MVYAWLLGILMASTHPAAAANGPASLSVSGELTNASGLPIQQAGINFRLTIYDATDTCALYSETHLNEDLSQTAGRFGIILGAGTSGANNVDGSTQLNPSLFNNGGATSVTGCTGSVALNPGDVRHLKIEYDLGAGYVAMTPNVPIVSSAYAMVAETLGGLNKDAFLQTVNDGTTALTQANTGYAFSVVNWPRLKALLDGTSGQYLASGGTAPIDMNGNRVTDVHDPTAAQDAATKHYVDGNLGGSALDLSSVGPSLGNGSTLVWDSTANKWVAQTLSTTPTGAAGGSLTGTYPNPTIANGALTAAMVGTSGGGINRLVITDAVTGAGLGFGSCAIGQVYAWTASGFACTSGASLAPVQSVAGKTGVVTLNAADVGGLGTSALYDYGTSANQMIRLDGSARLPGVDGSLLTNVNAVQLRGNAVANIAPTSGQVLGWNGSAWVPVSASAGSVTSIAAGSGLLGGTITSTGTLSVDLGTGANQVVQLNASAQLPAMDGSLLTNVTVGGRSVAAVAPSSNQVLGWNQAAGQWQPMSAAVGSVTGIATGVGLLGGPITASGTLSVNVGSAANQIVIENANAQIAQLSGSAAAPAYTFAGNSDTGLFSPGAGQLGLSANGSAALSITAQSLVGIGTTAPAALLDIYGVGAQSAILIPRDTTANRPTGVNGLLRYNTSSGTFEGFQAGTWATIASGSSAGSVTNIQAGVGLLGGPITTSGTLSVNVGTAPGQIVQENANAQIAQPAGSAVQPSYSFAGNTNTGFFSSGTNQVSLAINGTTAFTQNADLTATFGSNVTLVRSTNQDLNMNVQNLATGYASSVVLRAQSNYSNIDFGGFSGGVATQWQMGLTGDTRFSIVAPAGTPFLIEKGAPTYQLYLQSSGQVGIGTNVPVAALDVNVVGSAASAIVVPRDTSANRPTGVNGMLRYNTTLGAFEGFRGGGWSTIASGTSAGSVTTVASGTGLLGGPITTTGTLSVNVGTAAGQIVQENGGGQIAQNAGSAGSPAFTFVGNTSTGIFSPGANQLALSSNGTAALNVFANGNVGIGTTVASAYSFKVAGISVLGDATGTTYDATPALSVVGAINSAAQPVNMNVYDTTPMAAGVGGGIGLMGNDGSTDRTFALIHGGKENSNSGDYAGFFSVWTRPNGGVISERLRVTSLGNVGIGTVTPQAALDVNATGAASALLVPRDTNGNRPTGVNGMIRYNTTSNAMEVFVNGVWSTVAAGSNVGTVTSVTAGTGLIGGSLTTSGTISVNVGAAANQIVQENANAQIAQGAGSASLPSYSFAGNTATGIYSPAANQLSLVTNGTASLTVLSSGNVGIGTSSAPERLTVGGSGNILLATQGGGLLSNLTYNGSWSYVNSGYGNLINFDGSGNIGLWTAASGTAATAATPVERMVIQNNGAVGIGTNAPQQALEVTGTIRINSGGSNGYGELDIDGGTQYTGAQIRKESSSQWAFKSVDTGDVAYYTDNNVLHGLYVQSGGRVGVGTNLPGANLHVIGTGTASAAMMIQGNSSTYWPQVSLWFNDNASGGRVFSIGNGGGTGSFAIADQTAGASRLAITAGGNVGIGVTAPVTPLQVAGLITADGLAATGSAAGLVVSTKSNGAGPGSIYMQSPAGVMFEIAPQASPNSWIRSLTGTSGAAAQLQALNGSGAMPLTFNPTGGNVGIGTIAPSFTLDVETSANRYAQFGSTNTDYSYLNLINTSVSQANGGQWALGVNGSAHGTLGGAPGTFFIHQDGQGPRVAITAAGNVGIGTVSPSYNLHVIGNAGLSTGTAWTNASDIRLKDIRGDYEYGLDEVLRLHTVRFNYKKDNALGLPSDKPMTGFIAQEVREVIPDAVKRNPNGYLELNVDPIHWAVVNAIKQLYEKVRADDADQTARIQRLETENAQLKAYLCAKDPEAPFCH